MDVKKISILEIVEQCKSGKIAAEDLIAKFMILDIFKQEQEKHDHIFGVTNNDADTVKLSAEEINNFINKLLIMTSN